MKSLIYNLFKSLVGRWRLERSIPNVGEFKGNASFKKSSTDQDILFYKEEGILKLADDVEISASKEYVYCYDAQQDQISAFFLENASYSRLFHRLQFKSVTTEYPIKAAGYHRCINDDYAAEYHFISPDEFQLTYTVSGPKKDYLTLSTFRKIQEAIIESETVSNDILSDLNKPLPPKLQ